MDDVRMSYDNGDGSVARNVLYCTLLHIIPEGISTSGVGNKLR